MSSTQQKKGGGPPTKVQPKITQNLIVRVVSAYIYKDYEVKGKMDPYVKVKLGEVEYQTSTATDQGQKPKWGEDATFSFFHTKEDKLICELWEDDIDTSDDYLGTVEIPITELQNKTKLGEQKYIVMNQNVSIADLILNIQYDSTIKIDPVANQKQIQDAAQKAQEINDQNKTNRKNAQADKNQNNVQNSILPSQSQTQLNKQQQQQSQSQLSQPLQQSQLQQSQSQIKQNPNIVVQILSARILKNYEEEKGKMDPYFIMKMGNQNFRTTTAVDQGQNPKWNEGAKHGFIRTNEDRILLELWEDDDNSSDDYLGVAQIDINELISKQPNQNQYSIIDKSGEKIGDVQLLIQIDMNQMEKNKNKPINNSSQLGQSKQFNIAPVQSLGIQKLDASRSITKEELALKTKEIQDRLNNIQVKLRPQPLVTYIEDNVHKALLDGMKKLAKERPTNPIRELGMFLINYQESSQKQ